MTSKAKAKTINLLLYEGELNGVISIEDTSWNSGELYSAPRESVDDLLTTDACKKYGVYMLLSQDMVYVGQSSDLSKRITQHKVGKEWWESVVILTTKDDSLNHSDIDYLETMLIDKAFSIGRLDCENKKKGNPPKVDKFREVFLSQYLDEALFLIQLIGVTVFSENKKPVTPGGGGVVIPTIETKTKLAIGKRAKNDAVQFLASQGIALGKKVTYAVRQDNKNEFWINPPIESVKKDWEIILNDNKKMELIILKVPAGKMKINTGDGVGLIPRADKPIYIDLNINVTTLKDRKTSVDFSPYVAHRIKY